MKPQPELLLASRRCSQCLTTRNRIVSGKRAAQIVRDCLQADNHFVCHRGQEVGLVVHCRGVHDLGPALAYRFALACSIPVREVDPDNLEASMADPEFYIIDLRPDWRRQPYVTLWRPKNANYAWPLPWAGRYTKAEVDEGGAYYAHRHPGARSFDRFPVPCAMVEQLAVHQPEPGQIDGNVGPVLLNDGATRRALRRAKYLPPAVAAG